MIRSAFIYGYTIDADTQSFYFNEGSGLQSVVVPVGSYTIGSLATTLQTLLNDTGTLTYTISVNRTTRLYTIAASAAFDLLPTTTATNIFSILGYTADVTGLLTYDSDTITGNVYYPQFALENYLSFANGKESTKGKISVAPSGIVKATDFGFFRTMTCDFAFIGDLNHKDGAPVEGNSTGVQDCLDFLDFAVLKNSMDFSYDRTDLNTYDSCFLVSSGKDRTGLGYQLEPIKKLDGMYKLRKLKFRKL